MRKISAILAVTLALGGFAMVGCEQEAPKKAPDQKSDLGAPATPPSSAKPSPSSKP